MPQPAILVVDDDQVIRELLQAALDHLGFAVVVATSGREARQAMTEARFDVILTDLLMLDGDGHAVLAAARTLQPHARLIASSGAQENLAQAGRTALAGKVTLLSKPFTIATLRAAVGFEPPPTD